MTSLAVIIAGFLFTAFRKGAVKTDAEGKKVVVYETCLWLFLLCGAVTLFAGMTQVVVLFLLFDEDPPTLRLLVDRVGAAAMDVLESRINLDRRACHRALLVCRSFDVSHNQATGAVRRSLGLQGRSQCGRDGREPASVMAGPMTSEFRFVFGSSPLICDRPEHFRLAPKARHLHGLRRRHDFAGHILRGVARPTFLDVESDKALVRRQVLRVKPKCSARSEH